MARIRTIKPEFFTHFDLYEAERESGLPLRVAFAGLWTLADREGRFKWVAPQLKLGSLPYDDLDFSRVLDALTTRGFIVKYTVDGVEYGYIPGFKDHQVINNRESESKLPEPTPDNSLTRESRVDDARTTREVHAQAERKGKEGKGNTCASALADRFAVFWQAYPKKKSKGDAEKAWKQIKPSEQLLQAMLDAIERAKTSEDWQKDGGQYIPYPASWLRAKGWEDELSAPETSRAWYETGSGITRQGNEWGIIQGHSEPFPAFRDRVFAEANRRGVKHAA